MRTSFELAHAVNLFAPGLLAKDPLTPLQQKVLGKIADCRTSALGGHEEVCDQCSAVRYSYNSCGDRHCPKCQASKQALWIDDLMHNTLPVKHYHIIFTVPHHLNAVCLHNQRMYYELLFSCVWNTLRAFGYSHYGVESGAVAVLHTCLPAVQDFGRRGDRTSGCTLTSIALSLLPVIPSMEGGRTSVLRVATCTRFIS